MGELYLFLYLNEKKGPSYSKDFGATGLYLIYFDLFMAYFHNVQELNGFIFGHML